MGFQLPNPPSSGGAAVDPFRATLPGLITGYASGSSPFTGNLIWQGTYAGFLNRSPTSFAPASVRIEATATNLCFLQLAGATATEGWATRRNGLKFIARMYFDNTTAILPASFFMRMTTNPTITTDITADFFPGNCVAFIKNGASNNFATFTKSIASGIGSFTVTDTGVPFAANLTYYFQAELQPSGASVAFEMGTWDIANGYTPLYQATSAANLPALDGPTSPCFASRAAGAGSTSFNAIDFIAQSPWQS